MAVSRGDILRVIAGFRYGQDRYCNVYTLKIEDPAGNSDTEVATDVLHWLASVYEPLTPEIQRDVIFDEVIIVNETDNEELYRGPWVPKPVPNNTSEMLPTGCSGLVTLPTRKRKTRGRKFFPPFGENCSTAGAWSSYTVVQMALAALKLLGVRIGPGGTEFLVGVLDLAERFWPFLEVLVRDTVAYQRRRKRGVGH